MKTVLLLLAIICCLNLNAQNVNIPDANFKSFLVGEPTINTNIDTEIQVSEANAFTGAIDCSALNISDLTGIEKFTSLTSLVCDYNELTALDVTQNIALELLHCRSNQLTTLNVAQNTSLDYLHCRENQLTSLDVSNNPTLIELVCGDNPLMNLDVTNNTSLGILSCYNNQLTSLDVSNNTVLEFLYFSSNQITSMDVSNNIALTGFSCGFNQLTSLDMSNNTVLTQMFCGANQLTCLNIKNGNNSNFEGINSLNNPNLTCIEVDDVAYSNANWSTSIDVQTSFSQNCNNACSGSLGIEELKKGTVELVKITDLMGRETTFKPNTPLIYIYSNGTAEKVFKIE